ncbi:MAG: hypothetical protein MI919_35820, partial [Holophagales bacterium]|nr:hypothetical protein [Holophagales bacterium]
RNSEEGVQVRVVRPHPKDGYLVPVLQTGYPAPVLVQGEILRGPSVSVEVVSINSGAGTATVKIIYR